MIKILIADDELHIRTSLSEYLATEDMDVVTVENGHAARKALQETTFDCLVADLKMPGMDGLELLEWITSEGPSLPVIMMSAFGDIEDAVAAMKQGAYDYITKPFNPEELVLRIRKSVEEHTLKLVHRPGLPGGMKTESRHASMQKVYRLVERAAPTDTTVLITGESGTGKEVIAGLIHSISRRASGPFIPVNIAGIPDTLMESELFGYEKGAFTGAEKRKEGLFEAAGSGTIFLDEIGEAPSHLQVKLLRVLQEKKIQRLGATGIVPVDVRIIAATNRDLEAMVERGEFREDLFYRLNVIRIELPPLRERAEDLPGISADLLKKISLRIGKPVSGITESAMRKLSGYTFPGNIRELENLLERSVILSSTEIIDAEDIDLPVPQETEERKIPRGTLMEVEKQAIMEALYRHEGHRDRTAAELGITRRTLLNKIKTYGITEFNRKNT